jgi:hypothetical protein
MAKTSPTKSNAHKACSLNAINKGDHKKYVSYRTKLAHSEGKKCDLIAVNADWKEAREAKTDLKCKEILE